MAAIVTPDPPERTVSIVTPPELERDLDRDFDEWIERELGNPVGDEIDQDLEPEELENAPDDPRTPSIDREDDHDNEEALRLIAEELQAKELERENKDFLKRLLDNAIDELEQDLQSDAVDDDSTMTQATQDRDKPTPTRRVSWSDDLVTEMRTIPSQLRSRYPGNGLRKPLRSSSGKCHRRLPGLSATDWLLDGIGADDLRLGAHIMEQTHQTTSCDSESDSVRQDEGSVRHLSLDVVAFAIVLMMMGLWWS